MAIAGVGCFKISILEFGTSVHADDADKIIVFDKGMYGTNSMHQEHIFPKRISATNFLNLDFPALIKFYTASGATVQRTQDFTDALTNAFRADNPALKNLQNSPEAIKTTATLTQTREPAFKI